MIQTLADFFGTGKIDFSLANPGDFVHVMIDVQREFCDPGYGSRGTGETDRIAGHIADVAAAFRSACVPTYMVYFSYSENIGPETAGGGFHRVRPVSGDILVGKWDDSAFASSDIKKIFQRNAVKGLIVSGFNLNACVRETVTDACDEGYAVIVMEDCVGNDGWNCGDRYERIKEMESKGAKFMPSGTVLDGIRTANASRRVAPLPVAV